MPLFALCLYFELKLNLMYYISTLDTSQHTCLVENDHITSLVHINPLEVCTRSASTEGQCAVLSAASYHFCHFQIYLMQNGRFFV